MTYCNPDSIQRMVCMPRMVIQVIVFLTLVAMLVGKLTVKVNTTDMKIEVIRNE